MEEDKCSIIGCKNIVEFEVPEICAYYCAEHMSILKGNLQWAKIKRIRGPITW